LKISVIFTTYNSPEWLQKVLWGFDCQTDTNFEVVVADDGSTNETRQVIDRMRDETTMAIQHIWHEDDGFQKCRILNKALLAAKGEYVVMTDGDCIPRSDFIAAHRANAKPGYFLSGGYFKLPMSISKAITRDDIAKGNCFRTSWLLDHGMKYSIKFMKLNAGAVRAAIYNKLTLTKPSWNGHNASCYIADAIRVNGFDERMRYGGQDREFGERLTNIGLKAKQIRYSAICVHLDHARGYENKADWETNRNIRATTVKEGVTETPCGIKQLNDSST
jgi:glycosyltransferase involved in cell wall biosynthesis